MILFLKKYRLVTLAIIAILAGVIWRFEVEYHGWKGLIWVGYYHWAIPIAIGLFLVWANISIEIKLTRRIALNLIGFLLAALVVVVLELSLKRIFIAGPAAFFYLLGEDPLWFFRYGVLFVIALLPLSIALISRIFGIVCKPMYVIFSTLLLAISPELCSYLLDLFDAKSSPDYIHTIKSGYLMAFWFFALGMVYTDHSVKQKVLSAVGESELIDN